MVYDSQWSRANAIEATLLKKRHYRLRGGVKVVGAYVAPEGHNRLGDVTVTFGLSPASAISFLPEKESDLYRFCYEPACDGLISTLFAHLPYAVIGYAIESISIEAQQIEWAVGDACYRAGIAAANEVERLLASRSINSELVEGGFNL
jgi:hypothetical protein